MSFFEYPRTRTYDSDLGWIISTVKTHDAAIKALDEWSQRTDIRLQDLEDFKSAFENGNLPDGVKEALYEWSQINIPILISKAMKNVFFGITDEGYFVAYIPESWDDIVFNTTGYDINIPGYNYGHLVLSY